MKNIYCNASLDVNGDKVFFVGKEFVTFNRIIYEDD
jgi:hypothetical protein